MTIVLDRRDALDLAAYRRVVEDGEAVELSDDAALDVSGLPNADTVGDVWWLGSA